MNYDPQHNAAQHIEIYLDYATIPSLSYFLHFLQNFEDKQTIRLFGLSRFTIPQSIIQQFPDGIVHFYPVTPEDQTNFNQKFAELLSTQEKSVFLTFHINLLHSWGMFLPLVEIYRKMMHKIINVKLNFYEDGAEGIVQQRRILDMDDLQESIQFNRAQLSEYAQTSKKLIINPHIARYLWQTIYPTTTYHLLSDKLLNLPELSILKTEISNYKIIDFNEYYQLNEKQLENLLLIFNISPQWVESFRRLFTSQNVFLFTGTTFWDLKPEGWDILTNIHLNVIRHFIESYQQKNMAFAFKGHPYSLAVNQKIQELYPDLIHLPAQIPIEILYILGIRPAIMGGFASTSYLTLPHICLDKLIFFTYKNEELRNQHRTFLDEYELMKVVLELGIVNPSAVYYLDDEIKFGQ